MAILSTGATGAAVTILQRDLSFLGYNVTVDGDFGPGTQAAVIQFQTDKGLEPDGAAGPDTWAALDNLVPQGMDISHLNGAIDWPNLSPQIQFVYCKASQGEGFTDPMFQTYISNLKQKGLIYGAYHFLTFQATAQAQVANFMASGFDFSAPGTLPPALDVEWQVPDSLNQYILDNQAACIQLVSDVLQLIATQTGRTPVVYTAKGFMSEYLNNSAAFANYPLWIPAYQPAPPGLPPGWNNYTIWQHSGAGAIDGVTGEVDQDLFNGTAADLKRFANVAGV